MKGVKDEEGYADKLMANLKAQIALKKGVPGIAEAEGLRRATPDSLGATVRMYQALVEHVIQVANERHEDPIRHLRLLSGMMTTYGNNLWNDFQMVRGAEGGEWLSTWSPASFVLTLLLPVPAIELPALFKQEQQDNLDRLQEWKLGISNARIDHEYKDAVKGLAKATKKPASLVTINDKFSALVRSHFYLKLLMPSLTDLCDRHRR